MCYGVHNRTGDIMAHTFQCQHFAPLTNSSLPLLPNSLYHLSTSHLIPPTFTHLLSLTCRLTYAGDIGRIPSCDTHREALWSHQLLHHLGHSHEICFCAGHTAVPELLHTSYHHCEHVRVNGHSIRRALTHMYMHALCTQVNKSTKL